MDPTIQLQSARRQLLKSLNGSFASHLDRHVNDNATFLGASYDYLAYLESLRERFGRDDGGDEAPLSLYTVGSNECGQAGVGVENEDTDLEIPNFRSVSTFPAHDKARLLASGGLTNSLVDVNGKVWTWGCNDEGALGRGGDENIPAPISLPPHVVVTRLSCGDCHGALVALSGEAYWWGSFRDKDGKTWAPSFVSNNDNKKSSSSSSSSSVGPGAIQANPTRVVVSSSASPDDRFADIASGAQHTVLLTSSGVAMTFGLGEQGQLMRSLPSMEIKHKESGEYDLELVARHHLAPARVSLPLDAGIVRTVGCGAYHTLIVTTHPRGRVYGSGLNQYRQVCGAESNVISTPTHVAALDGLHVCFVSGGEHFSLAKNVDGEVYTWGRADQNQLGHAKEKQNAKEAEAGAFVPLPKKVAGLPPVERVACGSSFVLCTTRGEGDLYSWGFGEMMQLGNGKNTDEPVPKKVVFSSPLASSTKVAAVSCGGQHSAILMTSSSTISTRDDSSEAKRRKRILFS